MLQTILKKEMQNRDLSSHSAADAIGVSHTTILRALRGDRVDVDTVIKIADWLKIRPSELLNSMSDTSLADQLAVLLSHSAELEHELKDATERVKSGNLDPAILKDIVSYALYKLNSGATNAGNLRSGSKSDRKNVPKNNRSRSRT